MSKSALLGPGEAFHKMWRGMRFDLKIFKGLVAALLNIARGPDAS